MNSTRTLMHRSIDYAGLFPPAHLDMSDAVLNYSRYCGGQDQWALGRLIIPVARIREFERILRNLADSGGPLLNCRLSALGGPELEPDLRLIADFNRNSMEWLGSGAPQIDTIELRVSTRQDIEAASRLIPDDLRVFYEVLINTDPAELISAIGELGGGAKLRAGGVYPEMIPASSDIARFIECCRGSRISFKATAGLHHPIRSLQPLTYDQQSPKAVMHGFLNLFLGAAFCALGAARSDIVEVLEERESSSFSFEEGGISWRGYRASLGDLTAMRDGFANSFGSCSFMEPLAGLRSLNLL